MYQKLILIPLLILTLLSGCKPIFRPYEANDDNLVILSYQAVNKLLLNLREPLPKASLVVINSLVNVGDLGQSLPFGRIVSEQISNAFQNEGYLVMGMELPTEMFVKSNAGVLHLPEQMLTELNNLGAKVVVFGTYAPGRNTVYVSLRVVDIASQTVISSTDYPISMGPDAKALVTPAPIPVKNQPN